MLAASVPRFMTTRSVVQNALTPLARADEGRSHVPATAGCATTLTVCIRVVDPPTPVAVRTTSNAPAEAKACTGFRIEAVPPSPKAQDHDVGPPVDVSVKETDCPAAGEDGANVNSATGAGVASATVMARGGAQPHVPGLAPFVTMLIACIV
jgi:hypothetical protein